MHVLIECSKTMCATYIHMQLYFNILDSCIGVKGKPWELCSMSGN
jgi:hypothetical protein